MFLTIVAVLAVLLALPPAMVALYQLLPVATDWGDKVIPWLEDRLLFFVVGFALAVALATYPKWVGLIRRRQFPYWADLIVNHPDMLDISDDDLAQAGGVSSEEICALRLCPERIPSRAVRERISKALLAPPDWSSRGGDYGPFYTAQRLTHYHREGLAEAWLGQRIQEANHSSRAQGLSWVENCIRNDQGIALSRGNR